MKLRSSSFTFVVGLLLAAQAHADPIPCSGAWFVIPFVDGPAVCGDAVVIGVDLNGASIGSTVNPIAHEQNGASVLVGAVGTGGGAFGSASGSGGFADLSFHDSATMTRPAAGVGYYSGAFIRSESTIGFIDGFTVSTGQTVRITSAASGAFAGPAAIADIDFFLQKDAPPGIAPTIIIYNEANAFLNSGNPSSRFVRDVFLTAGTYSFRWAMRVQATASVEGGSSYGSAAAAASHTGRLFFDPLAPGSPLIFLSGQSYVPEPDLGSMMLVGLGLLGWLAPRRIGCMRDLSATKKWAEGMQRRERAPVPRPINWVSAQSARR